MNEITVPEKLDDVDKAIFLVKLSDRAVSATREILYTIFAAKSWEGRYSSWGEFVEDGLQKSQGWASKQIAVYEYYTLKGGIPTEKLELDTERLYMASNLEGTPDENFSKALTLNRAELRAERTPHTFERSLYCGVCGGKEENHTNAEPF